MIPDDKIAEIRERTDIVALIGEYVPLKRVGASFRGLCPFHSEKTPSFYVHPSRQFFHCFGCQASGDAIGFMMRVEAQTFPETARVLADRAGIELPTMDAREELEQRRARERTERLVTLMEAATGFYVRMLKEHEHAVLATSELSERGISMETAAGFRLGYAPPGWDSLVSHLRDSHHPLGEAEELGLIVRRQRGDGFYDRFRNRLMFPITDVHGRIVAFSGRQLPPPGDEPLTAQAESGAKYINSPEGPLYKKGAILYGLNEGRVVLRREGIALVCEGNFDLIALHQAGFRNAVAPMGTALTEQHAKLLKRFADRAVLMFDGDRAGRQAARNAFPLLHRAGLSVRVVTLPPGGDPDSVLRESGLDALRRLVEAAPSAVEHAIDSAALESDADPRSKAEAIEGLGPLLAMIENPVELGLYIERVARKFGFNDVSAVRSQLRRGAVAARRASSNSGRTSRSARGTDEPRSREATSTPHRDRDMRPTNGDSAHALTLHHELPPLECELVSAVFDHPDLVGSDDAINLEQLLTSDDLRAILQATSRMVRARGAIDASTLLNESAGRPSYPKLRQWLEDRLAVERYDEEGARQALRDGIPRLAKQNIERELPRLQRLVLEARRVGDEPRAIELTRQRDQLYASSKRFMQGTKR